MNKTAFWRSHLKDTTCAPPSCIEIAATAVRAANYDLPGELFPDAPDVFSTILRNIFLKVPTPDYESLWFSPNALRIHLSMLVSEQLNEYEGKLLKLDGMTQDLDHPHRNIVRTAFILACSKIYQVHDEAAPMTILDSLRGLVEDAFQAGGAHTADYREGNGDVRRKVK